MENKREQILERLRKVLALAKAGEGGERENAERQLDAMLRKYGLTMADIDDDGAEKIRVEFKYTDSYELALANQIVSMVTDTYSPDIYHYKGTRSRIHVYITAAQKMQCEYIYEVLKPALKRELETALTAFISVNKIYPPTAKSDRKKQPTADELQQQQKAALMAKFMDRQQLNNALEQKSGA